MAEWQNPEIFAIGLTIALLIVISLAISIVVLTRIYFTRIIREQEHLALAKMEHQQSLMWNSVLVQEKERERIASDLHDELISRLTVLMYAIQTHNDKIDPAGFLHDSIRIARDITHDLCPPLLQQTSLPELIENFVSPLSKVYSIDCSHRSCISYEIKDEIKLQLLRIVQEIINNITKHAKATKIVLRLRITNAGIAMVIRDNGTGFDAAKNAHGLGLKNIELRSELLKGKSRFKSKPGHGTVFQFYLKNDVI